LAVVVKTYKNLYPEICEFSNLYWAFRAARRGKRDRVAVSGFESAYPDQRE
jgi:RNA-directed DNA polymerase